MAEGFREVFKALLLPIPVSCEAIALIEYASFLEGFKIDREDHAVWTQYQVRQWISTGGPSVQLKLAIQAAIRCPNERHSDEIAVCYFDIHKFLREEFLLSHTQASAFLSHLRLICTLAAEELMSSAQIANLLGAGDSRVGISRQSIAKVLSKLRIKPVLTLDAVKGCFASDQDLQGKVMADADIDVASALVGDVATSLGCKIDFAEKLMDLCPDGNIQFHPPYIQMLHYQMVIGEYFDHRLTDLYEFSPRGQALLWLVEKYPDALSQAGNPFLNNAKSVEALTVGWARSKEGRFFRSALALYEILAEMEQLGFSARKELAQWVRLWIHRVVQLAEPLESLVPEDIDLPELRRFVVALSGRESFTSGILEQRIVDALSVLIYRADEGWVSRGVGDPVNATNTSKKKLGDVDFQSFSERKVVAFEAHGGTLTTPYLENHMQIFNRILEARKAEWAAFSGSDKWAVEIVFVAHDFTAELPAAFELSDIHVVVSFMTYHELCERVDGENLEAALREFVVAPINEKKMPSTVRQRFLELTLG